MALVIRPIHPNDAAEVHRIHLQEGVMPFITSLPSSRLDSFEERFRKLTTNHHEFVAELDGAIVGNAGLLHMSGRRNHSGRMYVAVHEAFHGQGIGSALIRQLLDVADHWLMLARVDLGVLSTNPHAQALYERFGFVVEGTHKGALISKGEYVDEVMMARFRPGGPLDLR